MKFAVSVNAFLKNELVLTDYGVYNQDIFSGNFFPCLIFM